MKYLSDLQLKPGTAAKYSLWVEIAENVRKHGKTRTKRNALVINGDDQDKILAWAEWKITNILCDFEHTKDNKIEDYKEVARG